jgi:predicted RNA-binding protein with PIN domain
MERWLLDGMNVIGSRPDRWWEDRRGAMRDLVAKLGHYTRATGEELTVVFDGKAFDLPHGDPLLEVAFASGPGRGAADDEIARRVAADAEPATLRVVTSDAELAARVRERGAEVLGAGTFRKRLDRMADDLS